MALSSEAAEGYALPVGGQKCTTVQDLVDMCNEHGIPLDTPMLLPRKPYGRFVNEARVWHVTKDDQGFAATHGVRVGTLVMEVS